MTEELKEQFECSGGESTEKYIHFSVPIEKETENTKTVTYKITFIDSEFESCLEVKDKLLILKMSLKCNKNYKNTLIKTSKNE